MPTRSGQNLGENHVILGQTKTTLQAAAEPSTEHEAKEVVVDVLPHVQSGLAGARATGG